MRRTHRAIARRLAGGVGVALVAGWAVVALAVLVEHPVVSGDARVRAELGARVAAACGSAAPWLAGLGAAGAAARARAAGVVRCLDAAGAPRWLWGAWAALTGAAAGSLGAWVEVLGARMAPGWSRVPGAWVHGARVLPDVPGARGLATDLPGHAPDGALAWMAAGCALAGVTLVLRARARPVSAPAPCSAP